MRNTFSGFKDVALKGTDICLLSESKIDDSFQTLDFLQKAIECSEKIERKMVAVLYYT